MPQTKSAEVSDTEDMVRNHLPLVRSIAGQIHRKLPSSSGIDVRDLVQEGVLGLMAASARYNRTTRVPFGAYAKFRIRGAILDSLRRLALSTRTQRRALRARERALAAGGATAESTPVPDPYRMLPPGALTREPLAAGPPDQPEFVASMRQVRQTLGALVQDLGARSQYVVARYALGESTLKQIGAQLGVSESRVSQIYKQARESMSRTLRVRGIRSARDLLPDGDRTIPDRIHREAFSCVVQYSSNDQAVTDEN